MSEITQVKATSLRLQQYTSTPRLMLRVAKWLSRVLVLIGFALAFFPWQQSVKGTGRVVAFSPSERRQDIHAPVSGRVMAWHVVEGSHVEEGDPIAEMSDIDPEYLGRVDEQLRADEDRAVAAEARVKVYRVQAESHEEARQMNVKAKRLQVNMAEQRLEVAKQKAAVATSELETARANVKRVKDLHAAGIKSKRALEVAQFEFSEAEATRRLVEAEVIEARSNRLAADAEVAAEDAEGGAQVARAQAEVGKAESEVAFAKGDISRVRVQRARQLAQTIRSPVRGKVVSIDGILGGGVVKEGQHLAMIVPDTPSRAAELYVDGNDAPLIAPGAKLRLQFEGWPALQFVGVPGLNFGTYGGLVSFVEPAASDQDGRVRVLVVPDPEELPWPEPALLRQQVRTYGWFLLDVVSVGREMWRQLNGFPPTLGGRPRAQAAREKSRASETAAAPEEAAAAPEKN